MTIQCGDRIWVSRACLDWIEAERHMTIERIQRKMPAYKLKQMPELSTEHEWIITDVYQDTDLVYAYSPDADTMHIIKLEHIVKHVPEKHDSLEYVFEPAAGRTLGPGHFVIGDRVHECTDKVPCIDECKRVIGIGLNSIVTEDLFVYDTPEFDLEAIRGKYRCDGTYVPFFLEDILDEVQPGVFYCGSEHPPMHMSDLLKLTRS